MVAVHTNVSTLLVQASVDVILATDYSTGKRVSVRIIQLCLETRQTFLRVFGQKLQ